MPTLIFYLLYPDQPYYLVCAMMTPIGHNWPVFHRFKGGAGQSCILGGMLVIDWVAVIATSVASQVIGLWVIATASWPTPAASSSSSPGSGGGPVSTPG